MGGHDDLGLTVATDEPAVSVVAAVDPPTMAAAATQTARRRCQDARAAYRDALVAAGRGRRQTSEQWAALMALRETAQAVPGRPRQAAPRKEA